MIRRARPIEVYGWKYTVCPTCSLLPSCPQSVDNIRLCHGEQLEGLETGTLELLLKQTALVFTLWQVRPSSKTKSSGLMRKLADCGSPTNLSAMLYCSDKEEYLRCLRSTSQ